MVKHRHQYFSSRIFMILFLHFMVWIGCPVGTAIALKEPTKTIPYPTKLIPREAKEEQKDQQCLILDETKPIGEWTPQEQYVDGNWGPQEKWMWKQICLGKEADLSLKEYKEYLEKEHKPYLEIYCQNDDQDCRTVKTKEFLQTILLREPFRSALPEKVVIKNAIFPEDVDLSSTVIDKELHLEESIFEGNVNFNSSEISQSLYFDNSTFKKLLQLNNAVIQGSLFLTKAHFEPDLNSLLKDVPNKGEEAEKADEEEKDRIIINLRNIEVKDDINLKDVIIKLKPNEPNEEIKKKEFGLKPLGLLGAQIGKSLDMRRVNFEDGFSNWCNKLPDDKETGRTKNVCGQVELIAAKIGDALKINISTINKSKLSIQNAQINTFLMEITDQIFENLEKVELLPILKNQKQIPEDIIPLLSINIDMQNANVNTFRVISDKSNKEKNNNTQKKDKFCKLNLNGFLYQQVNISGFNWLVICLENQYNQALKSDKLNDYTQLLQPFEQAAKIARNLGIYPLERELLYKRRRLDLFIAKKSNLGWEYIALKISDLVYGFGYQRYRGLFLFLGFFIVGIIFSWCEIYRKQIESIEKSVECRNQEIEDEQIEDSEGNTGTNCAGPIQFEEILPYIDSIKRIVFKGKILKDNTRESTIYIVFKENFDFKKAFELPKKDYVKIFLGDKNLEISNIKRLMDTLDVRVPENTKVGFCKNLFPKSGLWLVYEKQEMRNTSKKNLKYELYSLNESQHFQHFSNCSTFSFKRKRLGYSFIYSLDILLPIIQIDQELHNFIFQDSKGCTRAYFISQKLFAILIASILLPVLFTSGL